jgi:hypothetical protein
MRIDVYARLDSHLGRNQYTCCVLKSTGQAYSTCPLSTNIHPFKPPSRSPAFSTRSVPSLSPPTDSNSATSQCSDPSRHHVSLPKIGPWRSGARLIRQRRGLLHPYEFHFAGFFCRREARMAVKSAYHALAAGPRRPALAAS